MISDEVGTDADQSHVDQHPHKRRQNKAPCAFAVFDHCNPAIKESLRVDSAVISERKTIDFGKDDNEICLHSYLEKLLGAIDRGSVTQPKLLFYVSCICVCDQVLTKKYLVSKAAPFTAGASVVDT